MAREAARPDPPVVPRLAVTGWERCRRWRPGDGRRAVRRSTTTRGRSWPRWPRAADARPRRREAGQPRLPAGRGHDHDRLGAARSGPARPTTSPTTSALNSARMPEAKEDADRRVYRDCAGAGGGPTTPAGSRTRSPSACSATWSCSGGRRPWAARATELDWWADAVRPGRRPPALSLSRPRSGRRGAGVGRQHLVDLVLGDAPGHAARGARRRRCG